MAVPISNDDTVYFTNFQTGNQAGDIDSYFDYPMDLDDNFIALRTAINQLIQEVNALSGANAVLAFDFAQINDPDGPIGEELTGVIGEHSYKAIVNGGDNSKLDVEKGSAIVSGDDRVTLLNDTQLDGVGEGLPTSGGNVTAFLAVDTNGFVSLSTSASAGVLDVMSVTWNGTTMLFTPGTETQLAEIFNDGDEFRKHRNRPVTDGFTPAKLYRGPSERTLALERLLQGRTDDGDGDALPVLGLQDGAVGLPSLIMTDGAGTRDTTTGWYRPALNEWALAIAGALAFHFTAERYVTSPTQARARAFRDGFNIANDTLTAVDLTSEDFDIATTGDWHDNVTNPDRMTTPTGGAGVYIVMGHVRFDESSAAGGGTANAGDVREAVITLGGVATDRGHEAVLPVGNVGGAEDTHLNVFDILDLVATDIIRVAARQDCGGTMNVDAELALVKLW